MRLIPAFVAEEVTYQSTLSGATHVVVQAAVAALRYERGGGEVAVATLRVNSVPLADDTPSEPLELELGTTTTVVIEVTAQDQSSSKTYILIISQIENDKALLEGLSLEAGGVALRLMPEFSTATLSYATTVTAFESVVVVPRASRGASLIISDSEASTSVPLMNNQASAPIDLFLGATTTLVIRVTSQDESSTMTYSVAIRHYFGRGAILESLEFEPPGNSVPLTPKFASRHTTYTIAYSELDATQLRLSASVGAEVVLRVNGEKLALQEQSGAYLIDLSQTREIVITVRAQAVAFGDEVGVVGETQNTYTITLIRPTSGLLIRTRLFLEAPLQ